MRNKALVGLSTCVLSACTAFSPFNQTGEEVNRDATQYSNNALLLNVVRASLSEPLTFITITGLDGTASTTGTLGLPSIIFGPHAATSPKNYAFGSNSTSRTNSNTFHVSVVDDPASFESLLTPLNPGMLALFVGQGYPRELMFFLTVNRIREVRLKDKSTLVEAVLHEWRNDPDDPDFGEFIGFMASLLVGGLTAQTDITSIAAGKTFPLSKVCFDEFLRRPAFDDGIFDSAERKLAVSAGAPAIDYPVRKPTFAPEGLGDTARAGSVTGVAAKIDYATPTLALDAQAAQVVANAGTLALAMSEMDNCSANEGWVETKISPNAGPAQNSTGQGQSAAASPTPNPSQSSALIVGPDGALWIFNVAANKVTRVAVDKAGKLATLTSDPVDASPPPKPEQPTIAYSLTLKDPTGDRHFQIFMRSTYGVYDYVGALLRKKDIRNLLAPDESNYGGIVNVTKLAESDNSPSDCFASVAYHDQAYCVPGNAVNTKRLFALLHSLQELMTAPSNSPTTLQVTNVP